MSTQAATPRSLLLIDGSSYLYRAFHALPPLTTADGRPTGAVLGVLNMIHRILREQQPQLIAVVMDAPGKTFRDELFEDYKANRPPMPDELREQVEPLLEAIGRMGLPLLREPGVEADDVIGTLATRAAAAGIDTVISTGDKDMAQLVDEHITLLDTMPRGGQEPRPLDAAGVVEKFAVRPDQIIDYLALVGDTSDNIPGVPKIGPKTAAALLAEYDSVDDLLADLDGVARLAIRGASGIAKRLDEHRETLELSRRLATIRCDLELETEPGELVRTEADAPALRELYSELELKSLLKRLDEVAPDAGDVAAASADAPAPPPDAEYVTVLTEREFTAWLDTIRSAELVAFDTETTSLEYMAAEIVGLSLAVEPGRACYVPLAHTGAEAPQQLDRDDVLERLRPWLEDPDCAKVGHHLKYDAHVLANHGIALRGIEHDTMLESYVLNSTATRHDLDSVAERYLGIRTIRYEDVAGKGARQLRFDEVPVEQAAPYAAEDADVCLRVHRELWPRIRSEGRLEELYTGIERPLVPVLTRMEHAGVLVDCELLARQSGEITRKLGELEAQAHAEAGHDFNLGSPKQLQQILFEELELPVVRKTPKGQPSTAEDVLQELAADYELPRLILEHRALSKLRSTYTDRLPEQVSARTGRIHTSYHQAVAATGRLSSSAPNLQNIPIRTPEGRRIRQAFVAPDGCALLAADYSQIELRIMAHISGDAGLLDAFAHDRDIHQATAAEVFGVALDDVTPEQRRSAKAINFGLIYGMSAFGLGRQLGIPRGEAQEYVDLYFERYPGVREYMDRTRAKAREQGYVETVFGRRLYLPDIKSRQAQRRQYAERSAINGPMQGTAADIIKRAMIDVDAWLLETDPGARMIMQVHDELVLEVPDAEAPAIAERVAAIMSAAAQLDVPLKVETGIGPNWDEAH